MNANRLNNVNEYYFSIKLREIAELIKKGKPIINMGIGSPDLSPPNEIINELIESLDIPKAHQYQSYQGIPELRDSIASFYKMSYNLSLDSMNEVLPLIGSKEGIMLISMAFLNPGDYVLIPNPGYPTYLSVTKLVEAVPLFYDLDSSNGWLPDIKKLEKMELSNVKMMWINYPHMPTGAEANKKIYDEIISFGKRNKILIINDNPYSFILTKIPKSFLSYDCAMDVGMELNSLSKSFNMAGWRVGMLIGNSNNIKSVLKVKSNIDSGMFYGIQKGAIKALNSNKTWFDDLNEIYNERRKIVWKIAKKLNTTFDKNATGIFVWAKLDKTISNSKSFIDDLLYNKHIFITPGEVFGSKGKGYIRISLCLDKSKLKEALNRL